MFGSDIKVGTLAPGPVWGTSFGSSESRIIASDGSVHVIRGNGDSVLGYPPAHVGLVVPVAGVVRAAVLPRLDVGAHIGWYGAGAGHTMTEHMISADPTQAVCWSRRRCQASAAGSCSARLG